MNHREDIQKQIATLESARRSNLLQGTRLPHPIIGKYCELLQEDSGYGVHHEQSYLLGFLYREIVRLEARVQELEGNSDG